MSSPRSIGSRAARGAGTVLVGQVARIVIQVVSVTILARLLGPDDYGLLAIALAVVGIGEIFRDFGLTTAAIQARDLSERQRDKLFWLNTGIGAGLALLCFTLAPVAATLFGQDDLTSITRALSLMFLINGMTAQYRADLTRRMRFSALVVSDLVGQVAGLAAAIILAVQGFGYWALVGQQITGALVTLAASVAVGRWRPGLPRRGVDVRPMLRFGFGLFATQIVGYVNSNIDTVTIGLRFSPAELGFYNRGFQLLMRPLSQLRAPTTTVALPVLSKLRDDAARTDRFILTGQLALGYSLVALTAFAAGAAVPIVDVFLGPGWSQVAPIFALLAVAGAFQTISYVGSWVYLSRALTGSLFRYSLVSLAIKVVCVLVGSQWGVVGVAAGYALAPALSWPLSIWWLSRLTPMPVRGLYLGAVRILVAAGLAGGSALWAVNSFAEHPGIVQLLIGLTATVITYALLALATPWVRRDVRDVLMVGREALRR